MIRIRYEYLIRYNCELFVSRTKKVLLIFIYTTSRIRRFRLFFLWLYFQTNKNTKFLNLYNFFRLANDSSLLHQIPLTLIWWGRLLSAACRNKFIIAVHWVFFPIIYIYIYIWMKLYWFVKWPPSIYTQVSTIFFSVSCHMQTLFLKRKIFYCDLKW